MCSVGEFTFSCKKTGVEVVVGLDISMSPCVMGG
jgi:hypothetical protein